MIKLLWWSVVIGTGTAILTPLMIAFVETRPVEEWAGIAYFLLCQFVPFDVALLVACIAIYAHIQRRLARAREA